MNDPYISEENIPETRHNWVKDSMNDPFYHGPSRSGRINVQPKEISKAHFWISMAKSALRLIGFSFIGFQRFWTGSILLIIAEGLGILEEMF